MNCVRRLWNSEGGTQISTSLYNSLYISLFSFRGEKETPAIFFQGFCFNFQGGGRMLTLPNNFESQGALPREINQGAVSVCGFLFLLSWYKFRWDWEHSFLSGLGTLKFIPSLLGFFSFPLKFIPNPKKFHTLFFFLFSFLIGTLFSFLKHDSYSHFFFKFRN